MRNIYDCKEVYDYLIENYAGIYALDFTAVEYNKMLNDLFKENRTAPISCIKKEIVRFFSDYHQRVYFDTESEEFKLLKEYDTYIKDIEFDRAVNRVKLKLIEIIPQIDEFEIAQKLYRLEKEFVESLFEEIEEYDVSKFYFSHRDVLRVIARDVFELNQRDIILFYEGRMFIKIFVLMECKDPRERRFSGYSDEELTTLRELMSSPLTWDDIEPMLLEVLSDELNFKVIHPLTFKKKFIDVLLAMMEFLVASKLPNMARDDIAALSAYYLREYFDDIMLYMSEYLLNLIVKRDKRAEDFLSFFSLDSKIYKEKKIKPNPIIDENHQVWNPTTILSVALQKKQSNAMLFKQKQEIPKIHQKIKAITNEISEIDAQIEQVEFSLNRVLAELDDVRADLDDKDSKSGFEISKLFKKEDRLIEDRKTLESQLKMLEIQKNNKLKDIANWERILQAENNKIRALEEKTKPIEKRYELIKHALAKALAKR